VSGLRAELAAGLRATGRYLLSHHEREHWDRCHAVAVPGVDARIRLCARCSGVYPGIVAGALGALWGVLSVAPALVALLPAATVVERLAERADGVAYDGANWARTATGALLGVAYGLGLVGLLGRPAARGWVVAVGVVYVGVAAALLWVEQRA